MNDELDIFYSYDWFDINDPTIKDFSYHEHDAGWLNEDVIRCVTVRYRGLYLFDYNLYGRCHLNGVFPKYLYGQICVRLAKHFNVVASRIKINLKYE